MRTSRILRATSLLVGLASLAATAGAQGTTRPACAPDNGGLTLPSGFCATVFADSLPAPRHIVVAPNGDVFVATSGGRGRTGGIVALRDANGDGVSDRRERFGDFNATEVALHAGGLYTENSTSIMRYPIAAGSLTPAGEAVTIVKGLPGGGHAA